MSILKLNRILFSSSLDCLAPRPPPPSHTRDYAVTPHLTLPLPVTSLSHDLRLRYQACVMSHVSSLCVLRVACCCLLFLPRVMCLCIYSIE